MSPTGHLAAGFLLKSVNPGPALVWYLFLANFLDLLYMVLVFWGWETQAYAPWSHSLVMALVWSLAAAGAAAAIQKKLSAALAAGIGVCSHWLLDFLVWSTNLVTFDPRLRAGLGLYDLMGFRLEDAGWNLPSALATGLELSLLAGAVLAWFLRRKLRSAAAPSPSPGTP